MSVKEPLAKLAGLPAAHATRSRPNSISLTWTSPRHRVKQGACAGLAKAQAERDTFYDSIPTVMIMADGANRDTFVLKRGAYDAPGEKVTRRRSPQSCPRTPRRAIASIWRAGLRTARIR